jgi:hypothetical protein
MHLYTWLNFWYDPVARMYGFCPILLFRLRISFRVLSEGTLTFRTLFFYTSVPAVKGMVDLLGPKDVKACMERKEEKRGGKNP